MSDWPAPCPDGPVIAEGLVMPGSKSASARALVLAALAEGPSTLTGVLAARDTRLMRAGIEALGVVCEDLDSGIVRVIPPERFHAGSVDVGLSGTVMRFLPPVAALAAGTSTFFGDPRATDRPVAPLLAALRQAGAEISGDAIPFSVTGHGALAGGEVVLDAAQSSQFISALLIAGARCTDGLRVRHVGGPLPSRPYLEMTAAMVRDRGVPISQPDPDTWVIEPASMAARDTTIEPDLINAATFLCAGLVTEGSVSMAWPEHTLQAGEGILAALEAFGARVDRSPGRVTVSGTPRAADIDLREVAELTCVLAAVACLAEGPSRLRGVGHIREHETDRLAALATELSALGASVTETADGLAIMPAPLHGGRFRTYDDHRMAHAAAVLGLRVPGVVLADVGCTAKTMPDFPERWSALVGA